MIFESLTIIKLNNLSGWAIGKATFAAGAIRKVSLIMLIYVVALVYISSLWYCKSRKRSQYFVPRREVILSLAQKGLAK